MDKCSLKKIPFVKKRQRESIEEEICASTKIK